MNKRFLLVAALCAAMSLGAYADETNLAQGKTAKASSETENEPASKITDGDLNTRWQINSKAENETTTAENNVYTVTGGHWVYVDLGEAKDFNTLRIKWEGAYAKKFKVLVATDVDADTNEPNWKDAAILEEEKALTDFNKNYTYFLNQTVKARYVKIQAEVLGFADNYLSLYELGIYNLTEAEKVSKVTAIKADKELLSPNEEFTVNVTDQFDNDMTEGITYSCENATQVGTSNKFKPDAPGDIKVTAKDSKGNEQTVQLKAYTPVLTSVKVSPAIVVTGQETELTFTAKDQEGVAMTGFTTSVEDNKIKATEDGAQEITVTYGETTQKVKVYAVSEGKAAPEAGKYDEEIFFNDETGLEIANDGWNEKYGKKEIVEVNNNKMWRVSNVGTFGFKKNAISENDFTDLHFDIYSTTDVEDAYVKLEGAGEKYQKISFSLKAGQWNHIELDVEGASKFNDYIQIYLGKADATTNPDILLDNVYLTKTNVPEGQFLVKQQADSNGFLRVRGYITKDNAAQLKNQEGVAFDLRKVNIADDVTNIAFANPNALILVAGSNDNLSTANKLTETNNVIVTDGAYYYAAKAMKFVDDDKYPFCTNITVDTSKGTTKGYKISRELAADSWVTTTPLFNVSELPEGVDAFELDTENSKDEQIVFKKVETLANNTPYVLHANNAATFTFGTTEGGDFNLQAGVPVEVKANNVTFHGNYVAKKGTKAEYGLQNATVGDDKNLTFKKIGEGATIGAFRAYFTVNDLSTEVVRYSMIFGGQTTGIKNVPTATVSKKANGVYTLDGRKISEGTSLNNLPKGIYIVNGKKIIK